ncbi:hypothetical protein LXD69_07245 [Flavobacterium sediminilitoris]|uniref:Uncharacterized protein n=1 Tax=Flavobacterium sediminilitoris TaxID=2024526 RepID=A0ABY4HQY0_9FLAO|nr:MULTISPECIES: hypothetical protein [Flavobacterium]UOX35306.1 hypothetical protein LXD69_07245 [Flavobacterium sediminilitoris]
MKKYFEIVNLQIPCSFILNDGTRFDLRTGIPNNALVVYKQGFKNLGLKEGAEELFKKEKINDLIALIRKARRIEDVKVLAAAKADNEKIKEEAEARIKALQSS